MKFRPTLNRQGWMLVEPDATIPAFKKTLVEGGGEVVYEVTTEIEDRDFRTIAAKIKNLNVDAVFFPFALPSTAAEFAKQMRAIGYSGYLLSPETFSGDAIPLAGPAAEGIYISWIYTDEVPALQAAYKDEFHATSPQPEIVAMSAEAMWTVQKACKIAHDRKTSLVSGMQEVFGPQKAVSKTMKIFKIEGAKPAPVQ